VEMRDNPELKDKPIAVGSMSMLVSRWRPKTKRKLHRVFGKPAEACQFAEDVFMVPGGLHELSHWILSV
jgi:hypothetical protein